MSLQNYNYLALGSLSAENTRVLGLNQMELARIHIYQMELQSRFSTGVLTQGYVVIATSKIDCGEELCAF